MSDYRKKKLAEIFNRLDPEQTSWEDFVSHAADDIGWLITEVQVLEGYEELALDLALKSAQERS